MKDSILGVVNTFGNQFWKRSITQNAPQMKTLDKSDDFLNRIGISWLPSYTKGFQVSGGQIKILRDPTDFYNLLLEKIKNANNRIVLASLYLGTGALEKNLVAALNERLCEKSGLIVKVLLDCIRGSRGQVNSRKMLLPILENHKTCQVSLYQTPVLRKPFLSILPERYREVVSVQHIKVYLFDNDLIISGANLSNDYFTNRQDRYMVIKECRELADFVEGFIDKISECSFQLDKNDQLYLHPTWNYHPVKSKMELFINEARSRFSEYYKNFRNNKEEEHDTIIFPLFEMNHFNIHMDSTVTTKLFEQCDNRVKAHLTTGYFNLTDLYINSIISKSKSNFEILMAHPTTNGFYMAKGPAGGIPFAYTEIARQFFNKILEAHQESRIRMYEYIRPGWTYHAKGLWLSLTDEELPFLTMIGSPNFGERSVKRDLECQFLLVTDNKDLQRELQQEKERLFSFSENFTQETAQQQDRIAPLWVKTVVLFFRNFL